MAGGTINGEIYVWILESADRKIIKSDADEYRHREPIQSLLWTNSKDHADLISTSSDGKILLWHQPLKDLRYPLKGNIFSKQGESQLSLHNCQAMALVNQHDKYKIMPETQILVGTASGLVQRISIQNRSDRNVRDLLPVDSKVVWSNEAMDFLSNVSDISNLKQVKRTVDEYMNMRPAPRQVFADYIFNAKPVLQHIFPPFRNINEFDKHFGPVTGISVSPFYEKVFLTCSADGSIRLYNLYDKRPVQIFEPCFGERFNCVEWSLSRPAVFACGSSSGCLYIYDLLRNNKNPIKKIEMDDRDRVPISMREISSVKFNRSLRNMVAVGFHDKVVRVYWLSSELSMPNKSKDDETKVFVSQIKKIINDMEVGEKY